MTPPPLRRDGTPSGPDEARTPLLLFVDVEPDEHLIAHDGSSAVDGFPRLVEALSQLRGPLAEASGLPVHFTWCVRFDPQIATAFGRNDHLVRSHEALFERLLAAGDEIGVHTHCYRWLEATGEWITDHGNPAWVEHCVGVSLDTYEACFGRPCTVHRGGDRFMSTELVDLLEERGVRYDISIEPGTPSVPTMHPGAPYTGATPEYRDVPRYPYRPSAADFRADDPTSARRLQMIPLTSSGPPLRLRLAHARRFMAQPSDRVHALWRAGLGPVRYWDVAARLSQRGPTRYLALALRSEALVVDWVTESVAPRLAALPRHPIAARSWVTTPDRWLG